MQSLQTASGHEWWAFHHLCYCHAPVGEETSLSALLTLLAQQHQQHLNLLTLLPPLQLQSLASASCLHMPTPFLWISHPKKFFLWKHLHKALLLINWYTKIALQINRRKLESKKTFLNTIHELQSIWAYIKRRKFMHQQYTWNCSRITSDKNC